MPSTDTPDDAPLHEDDPAAELPTVAGVIRNLTAAEYAATYADGEPHALPAGVLDAVAADVAARGTR